MQIRFTRSRTVRHIGRRYLWDTRKAEKHLAHILEPPSPYVVAKWWGMWRNREVASRGDVIDVRQDAVLNGGVEGVDAEVVEVEGVDAK